MIILKKALMSKYIADSCPEPQEQRELNISYTRDNYYLSICSLVKPRNILEVGTWMGQSALEWNRSSVYDNRKDGAKVYCVDTWLGSTEHYLSLIDENWAIEKLSINERGPTFFEQFLSNIHKLGLSKEIIPIRGDSKAILQYLIKIEMLFEIIYIDGAHDTLAVFQDIYNSLFLISKDGLICGDDFSSNYVKDGVALAILRARKFIKSLYIKDNKFILLKKGSEFNKKDMNNLGYKKWNLNKYLIKRFFHYAWKFI